MRLTALACLSVCLLAPAASAGLLGNRPAADGIVPVEQAFTLQAPLWDQGKLMLGFEIAPGCYLYRSKLSVEAIEPGGYALGPVQLPQGASHEDEHFGTVEIYRNALEVRFDPDSGQPPTRLRVRFQGCAEDKVCYPMQTRIVDLPSP